MKKKNECLRCKDLPIIDISILTWAFRYCLGRQTYAVGDCISNILRNWNKLDRVNKELFAREILEYEEKYGDLGSKYDKIEWYRIVNRFKEEEKNQRNIF